MNKQPGRSNLKPFIWAIAAIIAGAGYYFLKDSKALTFGHDYFAYFLDVQGLQPSSPVNMKGVRVGKITDVIISPDKRVKITITVRKDITLPAGTIAKLAAGPIIGERVIVIEPGPGPAMLPDYAVLTTDMDSSLLPLSVRFTPMLETAKYLLSSVDTVLRDFNSLISSGFIARTALKVTSIEEQTRGFADLSASLNNNTDGICADIRSAETKTQQLVNKQAGINNSINNAERKTAAIAGKNIKQNIDNIQASLNSLNKTLHKLDTSSALGSKKAYTGAVSSLDTFNRDMQELQKNPSPITIFGGKKKKK